MGYRELSGKVQPEKVIYYWKEIDLRANWDMNETFNVNQNYPYPQERVIDYEDHKLQIIQFCSNNFSMDDNLPLTKFPNGL